MNVKPKNYIEPSDFFKETLICLNAGKISNKLATMFQHLCEKYVNHPKFVRYHHIRDDLISIGVLSCVAGFPKFRPYRNDLTRDEEGNITSSTKREWNGEIVDYDYRYCNNPFAFFTTCVTNDMLQYLKKEYANKNTINKIRLENGLEADAGYTDMIKEQEQESVADDFIDIEEDAEDIARCVIEWENDK